MINPLHWVDNDFVAHLAFFGYFVLAALLYFIGKLKKKTRVKDAGKWMAIGGAGWLALVCLLVFVMIASGVRI